MELCKYCKESEAIKNSHIIPSFIYEWVKKTSPTGYIRSTDEPNIRKQDGLKSALLCLNCERDFSKIEETFKKEYFSKVANYQKPCPEVLDISVDTIKCIYIMAWRALADTLYFPQKNEYTDAEISEFPLLLDKIKDAIETSDLTKFRSHVIPCTKEVLTKLNLPKLPWHFYDRSITAEPRIWDNWARFILYIKIPFSIIVFEIVPNTDDPWIGTQLESVDKIVLNDIKSVPPYVGTHAVKYYNAFLKSKDEISDAQQKKMEESIKKANLDCGFFKSMRKKW